MPDQPDSPGRRYVSYRDAAEYFGIGERTLQRAAREGRITAYKVGGKTVRLDLRELEQQLIRPLQPDTEPEN